MTRRYGLDSSAHRHGDVLVGGSPLRLFRLTAAGGAVVDAISQGEPAADSALLSTLVDAGVVHPVVERSHRWSADDVTVVTPTLGRPTRVVDGAVLVDDGSVPAVSGATIRLDRTRGPAAARNAGLAMVTTPFVAFVDADIEVPDDWLERLLGHFDDEGIAAVAPRVLARAVGSPVDAHERRYSPLDLGTEPARVRAGTRVSYVPSAALVMRVAAVRAVGGFDEGLRFGEDVDLVWRLDDVGWRVRYEPSVTVSHEPRRTRRKWWRQRVGYGSSAAPLARRHPGRLAPARMSGWSLGAWTLGVAHPAIGAFIAAGSTAALPRRLPSLPTAAAVSLAARGHLFAGRQLADAVRRVWWPVLLLAAFRSSRARRVLLASLVAAGRPGVVAEDLAYSVGVWQGMWRERSPAAALPAITSWPQRRDAAGR